MSNESSLLNPTHLDQAILILLVEDDEDHASLIADSLFDPQIELILVNSLKEALEFLKNRTPDMAIVDWRLSDGEGMDLLPDTEIGRALFPIILMTSFGKQELAVEAMKRGAIDYVVKSSDTLRNMLPTVKNSLARWREQEAEKLAEEKLQRAARWAEIGLLTGELVHRFNNNFASLQGLAKLIRMDLLDNHVNDQTLANINAILEIVNTASDFMEDKLLNYTRQATTKSEYFDIRARIEQTLKVLRAIFPANIRIEPQLNPVKFCCYANPSDLETVLTNLCINAKDAIGVKGGIISIGLEMISAKQLEPEFTDFENAQDSQFFFKIRISDTGSGMNSTTREKIFDPFFTTKKLGNGLGLATVQRLIEDMGGQIKPESSSTNGTSFALLIPCSDKSVSKTRSELNSPALLQSQNAELIILVDDEPGFVLYLEQFLTRIGYRVKSFLSPNNALDYYKQHADEVAIALLDFDMPELNGERLFLGMRKIRQDLPGILFTAYTHKLNKEIALNLGFQDFLTKPLDENLLAIRLSEILHLPYTQGA